MSGRLKGAFNDRLKRLGCDELQKQLRNKNKAKTLTTQTFIQYAHPSLAQEKTTEIFDLMRKEIALLTNRLQQAHSERQQWQAEVKELAARLNERDYQSAYLSQQLAESRRFTEILKQSLETAQSQLENLRLRQKMEAISQEISKAEPTASPLKHQKHKRGKFSAAVLPSAFGSPKKFQFRNSELLSGASMPEFQGNHSILRSPFSGYLIEEWQRSRQERNCKQLEVGNLQSKITALRREIARQHKEIQILKANKPANNELVAALEQCRQHARRNKIIFMKLRESENKRKEMCAMLKEKGENVGEEDKFYGYSTLTDINQMIEKSTENLQIERAVIQVSVEPMSKMHHGTQTDCISVPNQRISTLQILIQQLTSQLVSKQEQSKAKYLQMKEHYESQIQEHLSELQDHRIRIEENNLLIARYQQQNECHPKSTTSIAIDCSIINSNQISQHHAIIDKVTILLTTNQRIQQQLMAVQAQNQGLKKEVSELKRVSKQKSQGWTQVESQFALQEQNYEAARLNRIIVSIIQQREHFRQCYEQTLTSWKEVEGQLQGQTTKLRLQNEERDHNLGILSAQLQVKSSQIDRYRHELVEMQGRLHELEEARQKWENSSH